MDEDLHRRITDLVAEEHELRRAHGGEGLGDDDRVRLRALEEGLDRTWDLLRQREARRAAGQDPADARERSADVVEGYLE
jgi:hypothetical protein